MEFVSRLVFAAVLGGAVPALAQSATQPANSMQGPNHMQPSHAGAEGSAMAKGGMAHQGIMAKPQGDAMQGPNGSGMRPAAPHGAMSADQPKG